MSMMATTEDDYSSFCSNSNNSKRIQKRNAHAILVLVAFAIATAVKVLCMPAYRSTDFDVHRNWKALTRELPLDEWYFDSIQNTTVHTLDYPPTFAYFEYLWSTNSFTNWCLRVGLIEKECLARLPDDDNDVSMACVAFLRSTVILSDVVLWWGAWIASSAAAGVTVASPSSSTSLAIQHDSRMIAFLLIVLNPGLLWLDHVHFQYNGMLLGILLASLGCLLRGINTRNVTLSAILYCLLVTMKHLFLVLAPLYLVFLLSHYCLHGTNANNNKFQALQRFGYLATVTLVTLLLPIVPFANLRQLQQIGKRLFPFGRGLCHDYPAANVWSLYMIADKVLGFVARKATSIPILATSDNIEKNLMAFSLPNVSPLATAVFLLISLLFGLVAVAKAARPTASLLLLAVVYCSFSAFMLSFHVHEKAIMNALLPLTLLSTTSVECARLFLRSSALGLLGLFPLLFGVPELALKLASYVGYLALAVYVLEAFHGVSLLTRVDFACMVVLVAVTFFLEVVHPLVLYPWMEALPLLVVSVTCAIGLIACWIQSGRLLYREVAYTRRIGINDDDEIERTTTSSKTKIA